MAVPLFYNRRIKRATLPNLSEACRGHLWLEVQFQFRLPPQPQFPFPLGLALVIDRCWAWVFRGIGIANGNALRCTDPNTSRLGCKSLAKGGATGCLPHANERKIK